LYSNAIPITIRMEYDIFMPRSIVPPLKKCADRPGKVTLTGSEAIRYQSRFFTETSGR
jgi:hypothetical protein